MNVAVAYGLILGAVLSVGIVGGYQFRKTMDKAAERDELIEQMAKVKENLGILAITNAATVSKQQELLEKQIATNKAIEGVKHAIKTKPVGGCSITPDGDSLRQQAHQATAGSISK